MSSKSFKYFRNLFDQEIKLGDRVIYISSRYGQVRGLHKGVVKRITPCGCWVEPDEEWKLQDACHRYINKPEDISWEDWYGKKEWGYDENGKYTYKVIKEGLNEKLGKTEVFDCKYVKHEFVTKEINESK